MGPRPELRDRLRGSLLGGALGDALGAPLERLDPSEIERRLESAAELGEAHGRRGAITDETQLTLFTAEGLVLAARDGVLHQSAARTRTLHRAYLRWLRTQGDRSAHPTFDRTEEGWLLRNDALRVRRGPGNTCLLALQSDRMGRLEHPVNASKGPAAVNRVAPVGLATRVDDAFRLGCEAAALTHGHPSGYLPAGFLAAMIREIVLGSPFDEACKEALEELRRHPGHQETAEAVEAALAAAEAPADPARVAALGQGWKAPQTLAVALYAARVAPGPEAALTLAVRHGGASDSAGSLTGQLLGALHGRAALPQRWLSGLELRDEILRTADALADACT